MLHGAAMLVGLSLLWSVAVGAPNSVDKLAAASVAVIAALALSARFGGIGAASAATPGGLVWLLRRGPALAAATLGTLRVTLTEKTGLAPALMRVRPRDNAGAGWAMLAGRISAHSGMVVVETDADGLLVHVIDENRVDADRLESQVSDLGAEQ